MGRFQGSGVGIPSLSAVNDGLGQVAPVFGVPVPPLVQLWAGVALEAAAVLLAAALLSLAAAAC